MPRPEEGAEGATPRAWRRRLASAFVFTFVVVQVAVPASYYLGREDPQDDRFAWRMFTDEGARKCRVTATRDGLPVDLEATLNASWLGLLRHGRARRAPLRELERYLCRTSETGEASVRLACLDHDRDWFVPWDGEPATCEVDDE